MSAETLVARSKRGMTGVARAALRSLPLPAQHRVRRWRNRRASLPNMSIGLAVGPSPWTLVDDPRHHGPIVTADSVTDVKAAFVADPFAVQNQGRWYLFFELMNRDSGKGEIGLSTSADLLSWTYEGRVLSEPFHLSYPSIYEDDGSYWMVPESWESGQVRLYRAEHFPDRWVFDRTLLDGIRLTDSTLYQDPDGSWIMISCDAGQEHNQNLRKFVAPHLRGPWEEAADSPLLVGKPEQARPGGSVMTFEGTQFRMGQDCSVRYGEALRAYPLEAPWDVDGRDVITPTGSGWRSLGGHHADIHLLADKTVLAFIDGES